MHKSTSVLIEPTKPAFVLQDHVLIGSAQSIPVSTSHPVLSVSPVVLVVPGRTVDLQLRVSAPTGGDGLPIVLLSHGQGFSNHLSSLNCYGPLANFWAAHGFVVIQPTHLSSTTLNLDPRMAGAPYFWRSRIEDMKAILDQLDQVETLVPTLKGRLDRDRIAVAGHSMGGHTASMLLGARLIDPEDSTLVDVTEPRIKAGVLLAPPGNGGKDLSPFATEKVPFFRDMLFDGMESPTLVVVGDKDASKLLTVRGPAWHADPYFLSIGPNSLLTLFGGEHMLGGISGYDAAETTDENIERVSLVQRLSWAYLRTALYPEDRAWPNACAAFELIDTRGNVQNKSSG
jgi:fermentation-respiration switch protein FrsA (DUF1100 family)